MKRVVITSTGVVSPVGMNTADFWRNVVQGRHGFRPITSFDTSRIKVKCAAEIDGWDPVAQGLNKKEARRMDRYTQFAMAAAKQVVEGAGDLSGIDPFRAGVIVGSGIGGFQTTLAEHQKFLEKGPDRVSVFMVPMMISNMAAGQIAIEYGFKGDNFAVVTACATGSHSIGEAFRKIKYGYLDLAIAGGAEAPITEVAVAGFSNMNTLTESEDCDRLSIPFDKERSGFVMGEGAGLVLLEELEHARPPRREHHRRGRGLRRDRRRPPHHRALPRRRGRGARDDERDGGRRRFPRAGRLYQRPRHLHPAQREVRDARDQGGVRRTRLQAGGQLDQVGDRAHARRGGRRRDDRHGARPCGTASCRRRSATGSPTRTATSTM